MAHSDAEVAIGVVVFLLIFIGAVFVAVVSCTSLINCCRFCPYRVAVVRKQQADGTNKAE